MLIKKIICDKCKRELPGRTDKITVSKATEKPNRYGNGTTKTYETIRTAHLCSDCMRAFEEFLEGGAE